MADRNLEVIDASPVSERRRGLLFFALEIEAAAVFRELSRLVGTNLSAPQYGSPSSFNYPRGRGQDAWEWTGCVLGPGISFKKHLGEYLEKQDHRPNWFLLAGFSGGLGPSALCGGVFEIREIRQRESGAGIGGLAEAISLPGDTFLGCAPEGVTLHSSGVLSSPVEKFQAHETFMCDLVDMESLFFAREMKLAGARFGVLRAISDGPAEVLPAQALAWMDEFGRLKGGRLARDLFFSPWLIWDLIRMGRGSAKAGKSLGKVVGQALQVLAES